MRVDWQPVPTMVLTVNKETRQLKCVVRNWDGVSAGMLAGLEFHVANAIHQYHAAALREMQAAERVRVTAALDEQAGDGKVESKHEAMLESDAANLRVGDEHAFA